MLTVRMVSQVDIAPRPVSYDLLENAFCTNKRSRFQLAS